MSAEADYSGVKALHAIMSSSDCAMLRIGGSSLAAAEEQQTTAHTDGELGLEAARMGNSDQAARPSPVVSSSEVAHVTALDAVAVAPEAPVLPDDAAPGRAGEPADEDSSDESALVVSELDSLVAQLMSQLRNSDWVAQQQRTAAAEGRANVFDLAGDPDA